MTTFVLVHGAWHGGWCWRRVADRLTLAGHRVLTPTLTGLGERSHLLTPQVDLETHVRDIVGVLRWEDLDEVVLCGHSYGGMVVTGAADREAERVRSLVYLDALLPDDGQTVFDLLLPEGRERFRRTAREQGDGWTIPPVPAERFGVADALDRAWVDRLCTPHPMACFEQPLRLTGAHRAVARRVYVLAAAYDPSPFQAVAARLRADPAWRVHALPTGHDAMVTAPAALAEILLQER